MPNQPDPDKIMLGCRIPRTLHARLKRLADEGGITVTELVLAILSKYTNKVSLTSNDYEQIRKDVEQAEKRIAERTLRNKNAKGYEG